MAPKAKTVLDKVCRAVETLAEPGGASRPAIAKYVKEVYGETSAALLKKAIATGVHKGRLLQNGQRFSLPGVDIAPREGTVVKKTVLKEGVGGTAARGDEVSVAYTGTLASDGTTFDKASNFVFTLGAGDVIKGWDSGIEGMRVGEKAQLEVPPSLGYGRKGAPPEIPPDATLMFEVTLKKIT